MLLAGNEAIAEAIFDRQLQPSTRLSIDGLARQLGMSNTPVREALAHATAQRLVLQQSNRGFTVAPPLSALEFHDLFGVRRLLEVHALECAEPDLRTIERLEGLMALMPTMEHGSVYQKFKEFNQADSEFHRILIGMSENTFLIRAWDDLSFHLHVGRLYTGTGVIDFSRALQEHTAIIDALRAGDKGAVVRDADLHIAHAEIRLTELLPSRSEETVREG